MQAAPPAPSVTALKPLVSLRERLATEPATKSASVLRALSNSDPEPTEGDTPLEEAWFKDRPDIIEGIKRGLADMAAGRVEFLDPFEGYEDELDD